MKRTHPLLVAATACFVLGCGIRSGIEENKTECHDRLHAIVIALQTYHDTHKKYPPAYVADPDGRRLHSWRVLILPELGYQALCDRYRFDEPWDSPHNRRLIPEMPKEYSCPSDTSKPEGVTNYVAVVGCQTIWPAQYSANIAHATDGTSNTLQVVESCDLHVPWTEPRDLTFNEFVRGTNPDEAPSFSSKHTGGAFMAMMSADVEFVSNTTDRKILDRLATPTGRYRWPGVPVDAPPQFAGDYPLALQTADELKATEVLPVLDTPIARKKSVVYCSTFQIVWDDFRELLGLEAISLQGAPPLSMKLNAERFPREALSSDSYLAMVGLGSDKIRDRFIATRKQKFPNATLPDPDPVPDVAFAAYCYLQKRLPFEEEFLKLDDPLRFHTTDGAHSVRSFGLRPGRGDEQEALAEQVRVVDYVDDQDFVLELTTRSDPILLAKVPPEATLRATWQAVDQRVRHPRTRGQRTSIFPDEPLVVPHIGLFLERDYDELVGLPIAKPRPGPPLAQAKQYIKFQLDESGAKLESQAGAQFVGLDDDGPPDRPRQFVFDRPFLLVLRQANAQAPYFVLWVANTEVLIAIQDRNLPG